MDVNLGKDSIMIKDGMWFEDEAHYEYFLSMPSPVCDAIERLQSALIQPLIDMVKDKT